MAINFPNSPAINDTFAVGGINFTFTGVKWESGAVVELSSDTTPTLGGNLDGGAKNINNVGVITATGFSGSLTGNVTGNATGLTGDPSIQVTNATVLGNLDVQGTTSTIDTAITQVDSLAVEGSVGIGTDNPQRKLVVSDNGTEGLEFFPGDALNGSTINVYNRATSAFTPFSLNAQDYRFNPSGGTEVLRITSAGRFGFHTSSPDAEVHIEPASTNASIILSNDGRTQYFRIQNNETDDAFTINASDTAERLRIDSSGNTTFSGTVSDSLGQVRKIPRLDKTTTYTITANDFGKVITADADITIPNNVMSVGDTITIIADGSGSISIIQDSGLVMYNSADGATGNRTLGLRGMATIWFKHPSYAYISGSQLS